MIERFDKKVIEVLNQSKWKKNQNNQKLVDDWKKELIETDSWFIFPAAERVLLEFGRLRVNQSGSGIHFAREPFELDPTLGVGEKDRFQCFEDEIETKLYPLGEAGTGHFYLAIAEDERVFLLMTDLKYIGKNFDEALSNLIYGKSPTGKPL